MLKQKLALALGTMFLLSTVVLPGLVFAQDSDQVGTLETGGFVDVWYDGYGLEGGTSIQDLNFKDVSCSNTNVSVSATTPQQAYPNETCSTLDRADLVGIINSRNGAWQLQVSAGSNFVTSGDDEEAPTGPYIPIASNFFMATTGSDADHFGTVGSITASTATADDTTLSNDATDNVWYQVQTGSGYSYTAGDVTHTTTATTGNLQSTTGVDYQVTHTPFTVMSTAETDAYGIFAVAPAYRLQVPAGTAAVTYLNTITYDAVEV